MQKANFEKLKIVFIFRFCNVRGMSEASSCGVGGTVRELGLQQECYLLCVVEQGVGDGETMEQRVGVGKL